MGKWKRWLIAGGGSLVGIGLLYVVFTFVFLDFFVNLWWYDSLNLKTYYLLRLFYRYLVFCAALLVFFLVFFLNFWIASRYLGASSQASCTIESAERTKKYRRLIALFQTGSMKVYTPFSLIMAIPISATVYEKWNEVLLVFSSPKAGITDPVYGKDISFYLFSFPVSSALQENFLIAFTVLFLALILLYWVESRFLCRDDKTLPKGAKFHLTLVALCIVIFQGWSFMLQRYKLLFTNTHELLFSGPGFVEMWISLPLIWMSLIFFLMTTLSLLFYFHKKKGLKIALVSGALFLIVLGIRATPLLPDMVNKYIVQPNEAARESKYIDRNIQATLDAYDLKEVETRDFRIQTGAEHLTDSEVQKTLHNVPVWDRELLDDVFLQLQGFRTYYTFRDVDVGRYTVGGTYQQVYLGARELSLDDLPESARNWNNIHLQYTHGYGVVMTPAVQGGDEPMTWFVRDIPLYSDYGLRVEQPRIYYGLENRSYAIAPNELGEIDHPKEDKDVLVNYDGGGGIPIGSFLKKILFSIYYNDRNIFFTTKTNAKSRILLRQNIPDAISEVTPFFVLDDDPYIVATEKGMYWFVDGYTCSNLYPNSKPFPNDAVSKGFTGKKFNYVRNSVTVVVNAYTGEMDYYIASPKDPIIRAYERIYPGLLKDMARMPEELRAHVRYPKDFFTIQMAIYAKYHQTDPEQFYLQEDTWQFAKSAVETMKPYYLTLEDKTTGRQEFLLMCPVSPVGRDNLRALVVVGCDGERYGKKSVFSFPRGQQVFGPSQITALINQDTDIAQELTLWDQAGSEVKLGRVLVLPVSNSLLYLQPVYIRSASRLKIPELKRIIVSQGEVVAMDRTIEEALLKLENKIKDRNERMRKRLPTRQTDEAPRPAETSGQGRSS